MSVLRSLAAMACCAMACGAGQAAPLEHCGLGPGGSYPVAVLAQPAGAGDQIIELRHGGKTAALFGDGDREDSRASQLRTGCVGQGEKLLVLAGEFYSSGYPKGIVMRYRGGRVQRLDFAERAYPHMAYLSAGGIRLYIASGGPDAAKKWTVYRYDTATGPSMDEEYACCLPRPRKGETRLRLD
ncbi:hypothetical protein [Pseudoduganella violacea]|uniref:Lipoprotein n=1 Tax=Pseudoduganella violacea TaxID=1715466 RepID=A0A7W5BF45_9BURK|nr:hypothetical protein [Pseudoduganella violacea]MBB3121989.1 hypothetical protein [Pseudoduganella violacea]